MLRLAVLTLSLCMLALPVGGSLIESLTGGGVAYQFDGDNHHDAPDQCDGVDAAWSVPLGGATDGWLVPPDDMSDVFLLDVPADRVGDRLEVTATDLTGDVRFDITTYVPGCLGTVLDPFNQPTPHPTPPAPGPGESTVEAKRAQDPWKCRDDMWVFVATEAPTAPSSIHVAWTDGSEHTIPLTWEPGPLAAYKTTLNLGILVYGAWINLPTDWDGEFFLAAGPCDAVHGGAVYGDPPATGENLLEFTPVRAGPHAVRVTFADPPVDAAVPSSWAIPANCHYCLGEVEEVVRAISYTLRAGSA